MDGFSTASSVMQSGGPSVDSTEFDSSGMTPNDSPTPALDDVASREIPTTAGYGFRIVPNPANPGPYPLRVFVDGLGNRGQKKMMVMDGSVYRTRFSKLVFAMPLDNPAVGGKYICQFITDIDGNIEPDGSLSGITGKAGPVLANAYQLKSDGTSPLPTLATDGQAILNKSSFESFIAAVTGGSQISGGGLDIYRWDSLTAAGWTLFMQNVPVPIATTTDEPVGIPLDNFLLANTNDRWYVAINPNNPITYSVGASAFVNVYQRIQ